MTGRVSDSAILMIPHRISVATSQPQLEEDYSLLSEVPHLKVSAKPGVVPHVG